MKRAAVRWRILLLFVLPFVAAAVGGQEDGSAGGKGTGIYQDPFNWEHPAQVAVWSDELRFVADRSRYFRSESIYFTGLLDNGWIFVISLASWTYSLFGGWGLIAGAIDPEGESRWFRHPLERRELTVAEDRLSIRFPEGSIEDVPGSAGGRYRLRLELEGFFCDLDIRNLLPPWKPGDGYARLGAGGEIYTHFRVPCPWARVSGILEVGGRRLSARGACYGDLSTQVAPPSRLSSPVYALRAFKGDGGPGSWFLGWHDAVAHERYGGHRQPMLLLASGGEWELTAREFTLTPLEYARHERTGFRYPTRLGVTLRERGFRLDGEYVLQALTGVDDILEELPPLLRAVAEALVRRPVIFRGVGEFRGRFVRPDGREESLLLYGPAEYLMIR